MGKNRLIIITCGISLIEKLISKKGSKYNKDYYNSNRGDFSETKFSIDFCHYLKENIQDPKIEEGINAQIFKRTGHRLGKNTLGLKKIVEINDELPAEISSLIMFYIKEGEIKFWDATIKPINEVNDDIILLHSDTDDGKCSAEKIKVIIQELGFGKPHLKKVDNLKPYDESEELDPTKTLNCGENSQEAVNRFLTETLASYNKKIHNRIFGLPNLLEIISQIIEKEMKNKDEIVINITPGYKGTIPYLANLASVYPDVRLFYLYEKSPAIIEIPPLPMNFDFVKFRDYRGLIRQFKYGEYRKNTGKDVIPYLPLRHLLDDKGNLNPFFTLFNNRYQKEKENLTQFGTGNEFLVLFDKIKKKKDADKYKNYLLDRFQYWQFVSIGDRIPETVEHGRGHIQRHLDFLLQIMIPIFKHQRETKEDFSFITAKELFYLISAIWLHDIGHSGDVVKWQSKENADPLAIFDEEEIETWDIKDFPSLVRDYHSILSANIIWEHKKELFDIENGKKYDNLVSNLDIKIIALLAMYHRKSMQVESDNFNHFQFKNIKKLHFESLNKYNEKDKKLEKDRFLFILALLRIIDGHDVQEERATTDEQIYMRDVNLEKDKKYIISRLKQFNDLEEILDEFHLEMKEIGKEKDRETVDNYLKNRELKRSLLREIWQKFNECYKENGENEELNEVFEIIVTNIVHKYIIDRKLDIKDIDYFKRRYILSLFNQLIFKISTKKHFDKHKQVESVVFVPTGKKFKKAFIFNCIIYLKEAMDVESEKYKKFKNYVIKDMFGEYCKGDEDSKEIYKKFKDLFLIEKYIVRHEESALEEYKIDNGPESATIQGL
jgi:hypothetical protein